jgi:hypothetical protein
MGFIRSKQAGSKLPTFLLSSAYASKLATLLPTKMPHKWGLF